MKIKSRIPNEHRSALTRAALVEAARALFVDKGYADTSTPELVGAAGMTRGALYHHFEDKKAIFRAVIEKECTEIAVAIRHSTSSSDSAMAALRDGARAYLDAMRKPGRAQLLLIDGPSVLGPKIIQLINRESAAQTLEEGLSAAMAAGEIRELPVAAVATLLDAAFDRAALEIASGEPPAGIEIALNALLEGLAVPGRRDG